MQCDSNSEREKALNLKRSLFKKNKNKNKSR